MRCLTKLRDTPEMATRERYAAGLRENPSTPPQYREQLISRFDLFATGTGVSDLDTTKIEAHLEALWAAAETTRIYTNKIVAHREVVAAPITLRWDELDRALNKVGEILKHYYMLRRPGSILGNLTPELPLGWEKPFRSAWCPPDYWPDRVKAADDHVHQVEDTNATS